MTPIDAAAWSDGEPPARKRPSAADLVAAVAVAVVVLPIVVMAVRQMHAGWVPTGEDAVIFTRSFDVFSDTSPLVGQSSMANDGEPTYSPGPLGYQVLSLPVRFLPVRAVPGFLGALSATCLGLTVLLLRRRGGTGLAVLGAVGLVAVQRSLDPLNFVEIWNPHMAMAPFVLLVVMCWCIAAGDRSLLVPGVFLFSLVTQSHLSYVPPAVAALSVALVGGWGPDLLTAIRRRPSDDDGDVDPSRERTGWRRTWWGPLVLAGIVGVLCWAAPIYQQVTGDVGNLGRLLGADGGRQRLDRSVLGVTLTDTYGVPPSFLLDSDGRRLVVVGDPKVGFLAAVTAVAVVASVVVLTWFALRRRDRSLLGGAATSLVLVPAIVVLVVSFPFERALATAYSFRWFVVAGYLMWLVSGWGALRSLPGRRPPPSWLPLWGPIAVTALVLCIAAAVGASVSTSEYDGQAGARLNYAAGRNMVAALDRATERGGRYLVLESGPFAYGLEPTVMAHLRRSGRVPVLDDERVAIWGSRYATDGERCNGILQILGPGAVLPDSTELTRNVVDVYGDRVEARLVVAPDRSPSGRC